MSKRVKAALATGLAILWSLAVLWLPLSLKPPFIPLNTVMIMAGLPGGLVLLLLIARLAVRRFFDDAAIDGGVFAPGTGGAIDQRVLSNTVEQMLLAVLLWPFVALTLGGLVVLVMGVAFGVARLIYWVGYHLSPPLRAFGFGASFYPTVLAMLWAGLTWAT